MTGDEGDEAEGDRRQVMKVMKQKQEATGDEAAEQVKAVAWR